MNASKVSEIVAIVFAFCGICLLGFVYYPLLNPIQYQLTPGPQIIPWQRYVFGTFAAVLMISVGWYYNNKATRRSGSDKTNA